MADTLSKGLGRVGSLKLGGGTELKKLVVYSATFSTATTTSISAVSSAEIKFALTGILTTDVLIGVNPQTAMASGLTLGAVRVSSADQVALTFTNPSAGISTGLATTYRIIAARY